MQRLSLRPSRRFSAPQVVGMPRYLPLAFRGYRPSAFVANSSPPPRTRFTTPDEPAPTFKATIRDTEDSMGSIGSSRVFSEYAWTIFRYSVYISVSVVTILGAHLVGSHVYVERKVRADLRSFGDNGDDGADDSNRPGPLSFTPAWHLRTAWMALHWGTGGGGMADVAKIDAFVSQTPQTEKSNLVPVDWLAAEHCLQKALEGSAGNAYVAAELAALRERIGGIKRLRQAREYWLQVGGWSTSSQDSLMSPSVSGSGESGEVPSGVGTTSATAHPSSPALILKAAGRVAAISQVLGENDVAQNTLWDALERVLHPPRATAVPVSPKTSFFSYWSKSKTGGPGTAREGQQGVILAELPRVSDPALLVQLSDALTRLEMAYAQAKDLEAAKAIQLHAKNAIDAYLDSLADADASLSDKQSEKNPAHTVTPATPFQRSFLTIRSSLIGTHLAEVSLALKLDERGVLALLQEAAESAEAVATSLQKSLKPKGNFWIDLFQSSDKVNEADSLVSDALRTATLASNLAGFIHEKGCGNLSSPDPKLRQRYRKRFSAWCGGDETARDFYLKSMQLLGSASETQDVDIVSLPGYAEARGGINRTRNV